MTRNYNATGAQRKEMVKAVSEALDGCKAKYLGVPSCSYQVGDFEITRNGALVFDDSMDAKLVENVTEALAQVGFECEQPEQETDAVPMENITAAEPAETDAVLMEQTAEDINLSISLPKESFTDAALDNLDGLLESKGSLIRKAFGIDEATYTLADDRITFQWLHGEITPEKSRAAQDFIGKLCEMARTLKRVTAKPKSCENEKYAFRCFLLRLGLIGNEYKTSRKILLQNLSGSSAFKSGHRKEDGGHEVSEQSAD